MRNKNCQQFWARVTNVVFLVPVRRPRYDVHIRQSSLSFSVVHVMFAHSLLVSLLSKRAVREMCRRTPSCFKQYSYKIQCDIKATSYDFTWCQKRDKPLNMNLAGCNILKWIGRPKTYRKGGSVFGNTWNLCSVSRFPVRKGGKVQLFPHMVR